MATRWKPIRVSAETYARLQDMRTLMLAATEAGIAYPRQQFESLTLDVVIATLLDRDQRHRERGKKWRALQKKTAADASHVYMETTEEPNANHEEG